MRRHTLRGDWPGLGMMSDMLRSMAGTLGELGGVTTPAEPGVWAPRLDIAETDTEVVVKADLPGVRKEDLQVTATATELTISGEAKEEQEIRRDAYHRVERRGGRFSRTIDLPAEIQPGEVKAKLQDGVLEVRAAKVAPAQPTAHSIAIE